jgi:hypothetical protein
VIKASVATKNTKKEEWILDVVEMLSFKFFRILRLHCYLKIEIIFCDASHLNMMYSVYALLF